MLRFLTVHYCRYHTCCTNRGGKQQISFSQQGAMYSPNIWLGINKKIIFCRKLQQNSPWSQWSESRPKLDVSPALLVGKMTSPFFTAGICLCFAVYVDCNDKAPRLCFRKPGVEVWTKRKNNSFWLQENTFCPLKPPRTSVLNVSPRTGPAPLRCFNVWGYVPLVCISISITGAKTFMFK